MKMIWHQAIGQYVALRSQVFPGFREKQQIIFTLIKETLAIITTIIDMVNLSGFEFHTGEVFKTGCQDEFNRLFKSRGLSYWPHVFFALTYLFPLIK
jgi:hypothetical protein